MKKLFLLVFFSLSFSVLFSSCEEDEDNASDYAISSASWGKLTLTLKETGGPTNEWYFSSKGSSGMAALTGVDDFAYVYSKTATNKSEITFSVGGSDKYIMTWKSATTGDFQQTFNSVAGNPGTFTIALD